MADLPSGWVSVKIEDIAEVNPRKSVDLAFNDLVTFVPMAAVSEASGTIKSPIDRPLSEVDKGFTQFIENDVIFAKITPSMENGKSAVATNLKNRVGFGSTEFHVFRSKGSVIPNFLWYFIRQQSFRDNARKVMTGAVGQQRVPAEYLKAHPFLLPPLAEQERIAAKIDSLTARITRARASLDSIPVLLARYKSAILELAFSGKLTADLRKAEVNDVCGLPDGWVMRQLGEISDIQSGIQVGKRRSSDQFLVEVPYLRVANVQRGWLNLDEVKKIYVTPEEKTRLLLQEGDVLMNEGGDRDKLGRGWIWSAELPECIHQNHVFRIRIHPNILPPAYVSHFSNERGQQYFFDEGTQTTNLASISKRKVAALPIPVPPHEEALEIVRRIENVFAWIDRISSSQGSAFSLLSRLETAISSKAFCGELLSQDANDEPAAILLERTNTEWRTQPRKVQKKQRPRNKLVLEDPMNIDEKLEHVLTQADDWLPAQIIFERCGISDGSSTEDVEEVYAGLRSLDEAKRLELKTVCDSDGRKVYDCIRLRVS